MAVLLHWQTATGLHVRILPPPNLFRDPIVAEVSEHKQRVTSATNSGQFTGPAAGPLMRL